MPDVPAHRPVDPDRLRARLAPWLARQLGSREGGVEITAIDVPTSSGYSSETVLVDAAPAAGALGDGPADGPVHALGPGPWRFVVKTRPVGFTVFPTYDLGAQVRCMRLVAECTAVPAAIVRWYEPDAEVLGQPFYVMDRVDGDIPRDNLPYTIEGFPLGAEPADQERLWRSSVAVLAGIHRLQPTAVDLSFLDWPAFGPAGYAQQLGVWAYYRDWVAPDAPLPTIDAALDRLRTTLPDTADQPPLSLTWGDSRIGNVIYRGFEPVAVLDWEMALVGPGEIDLAWFVYLDRFFSEGIGMPRLPGFLDTDATVSLYEELTGRPVRHLDWCLLFAAFRFATIMTRINHRMRQLGTAPADWSDEDHPAVQLVTSLL